MSSSSSSSSSSSPKIVADLAAAPGKELPVLKKFNHELLLKTFLVGDALSDADRAAYAALHPHIAAMTHEQRCEIAAVTRYVDHVQHVATDLTLPKLDISTTFVAVDKKAKEQQQQQQQQQPKKADGAAAGDKLKEEVAPAENKGQAKKAEKAKKGGGAPKAAAAPERAPIERIDLRVGLITKVQKHPNADALYQEEIDVGEDAPRQVLSGLVKFMTADELLNRRVVVMCNLKPQAMRGIKSYGMVMCANDGSGDKVEFIEPPSDAKLGTRVTFDSFTTPTSDAPDAELNPKKKIFEAVQPDLKTNDACEATYQGKLWLVDGKPCTAKTIKNGGIK